MAQTRLLQCRELVRACRNQDCRQAVGKPCRHDRTRICQSSQRGAHEVHEQAEADPDPEIDQREERGADSAIAPLDRAAANFVEQRDHRRGAREHHRRHHHNPRCKEGEASG